MVKIGILHILDGQDLAGSPVTVLTLVRATCIERLTSVPIRGCQLFSAFPSFLELAANPTNGWSSNVKWVLPVPQQKISSGQVAKRSILCFR